MRITTIQNILHTGYRNAPVIPSLFLAAARHAVPVPEFTFDQDAAAVKFIPGCPPLVAIENRCNWI